MHDQERTNSDIISELKEMSFRFAEWTAAQTEFEPPKELGQLEAGHLKTVGQLDRCLPGNPIPVSLFHDGFKVRRLSIICVGLVSLLLLMFVTFSEAYSPEDNNFLKSRASPGKSLRTIIVPDYYPYTFVNDKGIPDGFSVDLAKAVVQVMGMTLEIGVDTWEHARDALENGTIDFLPMMASSALRRQSFDFSVPHTIAYDAVFVRRKTQRIGSLNDLSGKTVILMNKDAAHDFILTIPMSDTIKLVLVDSLPDGLRLLASGTGDAAIMPKLVGLLLVKKLGIANVEESPVTIESYKRPFSFAVKKGNMALLERLTQGLSIVEAGGQYGDIYDKWFGVLAPRGLAWKSVLKYFVGIVGASALVGMLLLIWSLSLKKLVTKRTRSLESEILVRKETESALRESEERYRAVFENAAIGIDVVDAEGRFRQVNGSLAKMLGYSQDELLNLTIFAITHPEDIEVSKIKHEQMVRGEATSYRFEKRYMRKDGEVLWADVSMSPVLDPDGGYLATIGVIGDITARKQSEEALRASEEKYRTLFEESFDGLFITSPGGKILDMNKKGVAMFGYDTKEEMFSLDLERDVYANPADRKRILSMVNAQGSAEYEVVVKKKNREQMVTYCSLTAVRDDKGEITSYRGIIRDITERKQAEEKIKQAEEFLNSVVDSLPIAVFAKSAQNGEFILWNKASEALFGLTQEQVIGKTDYDFFPKEQADLFREKDRESFASGATIDIPEEPILTKNLGTRMLHTRKVPVHDKERQPFCLLGISQDITDRKRTENIMLARLRLMEYAISHSLDELLQATLDEVEVLTDSLIGFYHFLDADQRTLRLQAWSTRTLREMCTAEGKGLHYPIDEAGVWVDCVHERKPVIHNDYAALPHRKGMPTGHAPVVRELTVPILRGGPIVAIIGVGNKPSDYTQGDIETVSGLADLAWDIAERKRAEEALRASEEKFRTVADWTYDWEYWVDPQGRFKYMSPSCKRVTGFVPEEFADDPGLLSRIVHPTDKETYQQHVQLIRERGADIEEATLEFRTIALDGTVHWIEHVCRPVYGADGAYLGRRVSNRDVTEREKAQQALRESEEQYRAVFDNAGIGIDLLNRDGRIMRINKALSNMLGYAEEELRELTFLDITHPEDREISKRNLEALMAGEIDSYRLEKRYVKKDGSVLWADLWSTTVRDEKGEHAGTVAVIDDVTKRKHVEQNLAEQVARMEALLEAIPAPVFFKNTDHVYIGCNSAFAEFIGRPKEHVIGKTVFEVAPRELAEIYRTHDDALFNNPGSQVYETSLMSSDGSRHDVVYHKATFLDSIGAVAGLIGVILDITDRKKVEEALRESEAFYRSLYENISDCIFIIDVTPDGRFKFVSFNPAEEKAVGMTTEQVANRYTDDLVSKEVAQHMNSRYQMCVEERKTIHYEEVLDLPKDKMSFFTSLVPVEGPDGRIYRIIGVARDISEQQSLQRQLLQAQKMEAIGTLAGGIAHDFNNLLTIVLGYSELLLAEKQEDDREYADLQKILHAAKSGAELVQRLLMFSRKSEPKPVPMNLNNQIMQVEKLLRRTIPRMVDIRLDLSADLPEIHADPSQMQQVLMNLAVNARDAMSNGGSLTVRTSKVTVDEEYARLHVEARPGEYVLLEISDTGHGMDKETVEHIFEPFFTTKEMGRGTGLGLAMVHGIVKQHNGHITVYSEVGKGTTFKVYFPAMPADVEPDVVASGIMPAFGTETVLLVDDEEFVRELGARILTKHGYTVLQAKNGREALDLFKKERLRISLVILDLIMPEMGGTECLEELRKIDPHVNVLVASGYSGDASVKETIQLGAKGFVTKPFRVKELLRDVRRVLDGG